MRRDIINVIQTLLFDGPVSWPDIVFAIKDSGIKIKDWMVVRNNLQYLIDHDICYRSRDINVEVYFPHNLGE